MAFAVDVYVVEVSLKETGPVLRCVCNAKHYFNCHPSEDSHRSCSAIKTIPKQDSINVHHLRRVVKQSYLPKSLIRIKEVHSAPQTLTPIGQQSLLINDDATTTLDSTPTDGGREITSEGLRPKRLVSETVYIFLAPTSLIGKEDLYALLHSRVPRLFARPSNQKSSEHTTISLETAHIGQLGIPSASTKPTIFTLPVPAHAPASLVHAAAQSSTLWPTTFNPNTTYGPNPSLVASSQAEIEASAQSYIALARHAGDLASLSGPGQGIGAVIVERADDGVEHIVAVAGDRRWENCRGASKGNGDPSKHAVMRAIDFVARKRRAMLDREDSAALESRSIIEPQTSDGLTTRSRLLPSLGQQDSELATLEQPYLDSRTNLAPNGYLCLNLEVYTSHEPCVMCSMALVHSRVGKVVFGRRMPRTGGLTAEMGQSNADSGVEAGLGYGLFWRESLNWRFLCWEWRDEEEHDRQDKQAGMRLRDGDTVADDVHA